MTDKIKEAAFKVFPHTNEGNVEDDIDAAKRSIWIAGATSEAAREYWEGQGWVRVESPPIINERVLLVIFSLGEQYVCIGKLSEDGYYRKDKGSIFKPMEMVEFWQALPAPPNQ